MILDLVLNGLVQGSLLALICIGYSLAYGSAKVINFAHADVMIAGGGYLVLLWVSEGPQPLLRTAIMVALFGAGTYFSTLTLLPEQYGPTRGRWLTAGLLGLVVAGATYLFIGRLHFVLAMLLAIPWTGALATAVYRVGYLPLLRRDSLRTSVLLAALGLSIAVESCLLIAWGSERRVFPAEVLPSSLVVKAVPEGIGAWEAPLDYGVLPLGPELWIPVYDVAIVVIFAVVVFSLILFFHFTRTADAIVAAADSKLAARACGIPVDRVFGQAFFLGGAVAALGGTLYVLRSKSLDPMAGFTPGILAFAACVLGGIGSLRGSIAGGFIVSMVTALAPAVPLAEWASAYLPSSWLQWLPSLNLNDWSYGVVYVLMIVTILFKPQGLFAR